MYIGPVAAAAVRTCEVIARLRKELDREPTDNEVRVALGLGPIIAVGELKYFAPGLLGGSVALGSRFRLHFDPERNGVIQLRLEEVLPEEAN